MLMFAPNDRIYEVGYFILKKVVKEDLHKYKFSEIKTTSDNGKPFADLIDLVVSSRQNKTSQAGCRVNLKKNKFESTVKKDEDGIYRGDVSLSYSILDDKGEELFNYTLEIKDYYNPKIGVHEKYTEALLQIAFSGIFATPQDYDVLADFMAEARGEARSAETYVCEECKHCFHIADKLITHLAETGHYDSIFDEFPYYEPLYRIREIYGHILRGENKNEH